MFGIKPEDIVCHKISGEVALVISVNKETKELELCFCLDEDGYSICNQIEFRKTHFKPTLKVVPIKTE